MRKTWKKLVVCGTICALTISSLSFGGNKTKAAATVGTAVKSGASTKDVTVPDNPAPFRDLTSDEMIAEMGIGWNLGNTLDGHSNYAVGETLWQSTKTTKEIIKGIHDSGFNTIRIPVTWGDMINADYSVYEEWMGRVEDIINYATAENMYVMINIHHDGADNGSNSPHGWLNIGGDTEGSFATDEQFAVVKEKFDGLWKTIAERFKNYDEHLIFASMNEVFSAGNGWTTDLAPITTDMARINTLNQSFVDVVRATGGNNAKRWLVAPIRNTQIDKALSRKYEFKVPTDIGDQKHIMMEVHDYDTFSSTSMSESTVGSYAQQFNALKTKYVDAGVPVVVGEFGFNQGGRKAYWFEGVSFLLKKYKMIGTIWDNGGDYKVYDRAKLSDVKDDDGNSFVDAMMRGYYYDTGTAQIGENISVTPATDFNVSDSAVSMEAGEIKEITVSDIAPSNSNDVILWKSSDGAVASVTNGKITARAVGTAKITAFAQSTPSVKKEITVTIEPQTLSTASTDIKTDYDEYSIDEEGEAFINGMAQPADNGAFVTYKSSDESVVTVSTMGKLRAIGKGEATVTATTSDGKTKDIKVAVVEPTGKDVFDVRLALNVRYNYKDANDKNKSYSGDEVASDVIRVTKDGTYTLKFDTTNDLTSEAKDAGITNLNYIGSMWIQDWDVTKKNAKRSPKINGKISYTSIKVDGTELLSATTKNYDTLSPSNIFDTGNPMNVWRMSDLNVPLKGVTKNTVYAGTDDEAQNFVFAQDNPKVISVTFRLSGFTGPIIDPYANPNPNPGGTNKADPLKVNKASTIVAPGKSVKVGYTSSKTPTVKSNNKKVTAKVSGKYIVITANKKATKGSKATITVTVGSKKAKIIATVRNKAKKISKAKTATIKKKGKTTNLTFKVTADNKKAAVADTIKATVAGKKIAKVTKLTVKKGKVIVKVKALKKGKTTVTLKIGSKKAKAVVNVKK